MKTTKVTKNQQFNYVLFALVAGVAGEIGYMAAQSIIGLFFEATPANSVLISLSFIPIILIAAFTTLALFFLIRNHVYDQYYESDDRKAWLFSCIRYCLPGEIVKFIICMVPISVCRFGAFINRISRLIYDIVYLTKTPRYLKILYEYAYQPSDFVVYFFVQLLSLVILLPLVAFVYRYHWMKADNEHRELTRYQRND